mgnify:CR=1 FL=1|tara:strand:+ start:443 stop:1228 length:786 start_codon:yes stop_codon:yes gene_type:complete
MDKLSFIFFGTTNYSKDLLLFLLKNKFYPKMIFSSPSDFKISYSKKKIKNYNHADLKQIAKKYKLPYYEIDSSSGKRINAYKAKIAKLNPDLMLVLGWYYKIPKYIRKLSKFGAWGIHASLLPNYAGGAPLTWAIIKGEKKTGVTLFKLDDGVDDGDIILQKSFLIKKQDTIKDVYFKATEKSKEILVKVLNNMDQVRFTPQDKKKINIFPQRRPEDGEIDLSKSADQIYNFVRAQSSPYPGAFIKTTDGKKLIIEKIKKV